MSRPRLMVVLGLGACACLWVASVLIVDFARLDHRGLIQDIRAQESMPPLKMVQAAIVDYERGLRYVPCSAALHSERGLLLAYVADKAMASPDMDAADEALARMQEALSAQLACTPNDGKAWLDSAQMMIHREGFTERARAAYAMSAEVSPGESWLAQKRLLFALQFRLLLDAPSRAVAVRDITVLEHAHPNRINAVMAAANVDSAEALRGLFAVATSD